MQYFSDEECSKCFGSILCDRMLRNRDYIRGVILSIEMGSSVAKDVPEAVVSEVALAKRCRCSIRTLRKSIANLVAAGWIRVADHSPGHKRYTLRWLNGEIDMDSMEIEHEKTGEYRYYFRENPVNPEHRPGFRG